MNNYAKWSDIRDRHVAYAGGEEVVATLTNKMLAEVHAYRLAETQRQHHLANSTGDSTQQ